MDKFMVIKYTTFNDILTLNDSYDTFENILLVAGDCIRQTPQTL
jgi:hypothetical protein